MYNIQESVQGFKRNRVWRQSVHSMQGIKMANTVTVKLTTKNHNQFNSQPTVENSHLDPCFWVKKNLIKHTRTKTFQLCLCFKAKPQYMNQNHNPTHKAHTVTIAMLWCRFATCAITGMAFFFVMPKISCICNTQNRTNSILYSVSYLKQIFGCPTDLICKKKIAIARFWMRKHKKKYLVT